MNYKLKILNLKCYLPDESDGDEIYLLRDGKKIWPTDAGYMHIDSENTPIGLDYVIQKGDRINIELWDHDKLSANDHLGNLTIKADAHGNYVNEFTKQGSDQSKYALQWEIG